MNTGADNDLLSLVWLRRDLRLVDNRALAAAGKASRKVALVFVFDTNILNQLNDSRDRRVSFIYDSVVELSKELEKKGSQLIVRHGDPVVEIPKLVKTMGASSLYYNEDYENYAKTRDKKVAAAVTKLGSEVQAFKDHVIFCRDEVTKPDGQPYRMFTPYKKAWIKKFSESDVSPQRSKCKFYEKKDVSKLNDKVDLKKLGFEHANQYFPFQKPGRKEGLKALSNFLKEIANYDKNRDYPHLIAGTSGLSVHLRFGTVSIRECVRACKATRSKGAHTWLSELIWREFYSMILDQYPHVETECFKQQFNKITWRNSSKLFKAWCVGRTGFPIVDAGMRQLNETGWMHNRVRMITASFLVKDLLIDWRKGEAYFAEKLLDFELASNNGGWQWCASTGCDAQPYFRVFNPSLQSKRFDPEAVYIKTWVPELKDCEIKDIHNPENSQLHRKSSYPKPVVDHATQKMRALELFDGV